MPCESAIEHRRHDDSSRAEKRELRSPDELVCARDFDRPKRPSHGRHILRREQAGSVSKSESCRAVGKCRRVGTTAVDVKIRAVPERSRELERRGRPLPDARQWRERQRDLRPSAQRLQRHRHRRRHCGLRAFGSEARLLRRRTHDGSWLRYAHQLRLARIDAGRAALGRRLQEGAQRRGHAQDDGVVLRHAAAA